MAVMNRALRSDSERTRQRILDIARDLVCLADGYEQVRMADIAARVGCSRATVYNHFATRDDLLEALCLEYLEGYLDLFVVIRDWLTAQHTVYDVLRETVAAELRWRTRHNALRGALDSARRLRASFYVEAETRIDDAMLAWYSEIYRASGARGLLRGGADPARIARPIYAMTDSVLAAFPVGASASEIDRAADEVAQLHWYAVYRGEPGEAPAFSSIGVDVRMFADAYQRAGATA